MQDLFQLHVPLYQSLNDFQVRTSRWSSRFAVQAVKRDALIMESPCPVAGKYELSIKAMLTTSNVCKPGKRVQDEYLIGG